MNGHISSTSDLFLEKDGDVCKDGSGTEIDCAEDKRKFMCFKRRESINPRFGVCLRANNSKNSFWIATPHGRLIIVGLETQ